MKALPPPKLRSAPPAPVIAGLGRDALARLTPEQISARSQAANERAAASGRRSVARALAARVASLPKPVAAPTRPKPIAARPEFTPEHAALLIRFANAYDAGKPVHVGLTPHEVSVAYAHGRRLRDQHHKF